MNKDEAKKEAIDLIVKSENYPAAFYRESHALAVGAGRGFDAGYDQAKRETLLDFCNEVDERAQKLMLADGKVSGKHYAAMRLILKERGIEWGR